MNQRRTGLPDHLLAGHFARFFRRLAKYNLRPIPFHCAHFHFGRVRRHDDMRRNATQLRRASHRSAVIAGRMRSHSALRGCIAETKDRISRAPRLERADLLKILTLEKQRRVTRFIESRARQHRRALNIWTNPFMRPADTIEIE